MIDKKNITGIILAGGQSLRMGSDKGFLRFNGKTFIQHSIDALSPLVIKIIIVSNNPEYDVFQVKRVDDLMENAGPLAGLYTGLYYSETNHNLVLSCDIPLINTAVLRKLIMASDDATDVVQFQGSKKPTPLIALYKKHCNYMFFKLLQQGERRLRVAADQCSVKNITIDTALQHCITNINTPNQLKTIAHDIND